MTANTFALEDDIASDIASEAALARNADNLTSGTVADTRIASTIARDSEVTAAVAAEAALARNADNLTSGTVAIARLPIDADVATLSLPASTTISSFGASLIDDAAASNARTTLGLGTAATSNTGDFDAAGAAAAAQAASQPLDGDLTTLAGLTATTDNMIQSVGSAWASRTPTQVKTALSLNNVDNTSDANKPVSTAQQTALNLKANLASPTFTGTVVLPSSQILTSAVLNTGVSGTAIDTDSTMAANSDTILASQKATKTALDLKAPLASPSFTGSPKIGTPSYTSTTLSVSGQIGVEDTGGLGLLFIGTGFGVQPALDLRRVNGTFAVPAKVDIGDVIASINVGACTTNTTTPPVLDDVAQIWCVATQAYSPTANGNEWQFYTTPNNSSTKTKALTIGQDQSLAGTGNWTTNGTLTAASSATNPFSVNSSGNASANILTALAATGFPIVLNPNLTGVVFTVAASGAVTSVAAIKSQGATSGIGYGTGAGGTVTQITNKSTGVTLDQACGKITMNNAALANGAQVGFTLTNAAIAATDVVIVNVASGATANAYIINVDAVAAGSCHITIRNISGGSLSEAIVVSFAVIKAVTA